MIFVSINFYDDSLSPFISRYNNGLFKDRHAAIETQSKRDHIL